MMAYADFEFYKTEYGGKAIAETDFPGLANRAAAYINAVTAGAAARATTGNPLYMVQMANCALAEITQDEDRLNAGTFTVEAQVASETVGSWSRSYNTGNASAVHLELLTSRKDVALETYLGPLGYLRIRPVRRCCR